MSRMVRAVKTVNGERVVVRVPAADPEDLVLADPARGVEASNPPGSFEALYVVLAGELPPLSVAGA